MATANITVNVEFISGSPPLKLGSTMPVTISSLTQKHYAEYVLATATKKTLLTLGATTDFDLPDFDLLVIISTQDLSLETFGTTQAANGNWRIKANVPFILAADDTRAYAAGGDFSGAAQVITNVRVFNESGSNASIQILAAT